MKIVDLLVDQKAVHSLSEARRAIAQGACRINGETIKDIEAEFVAVEGDEIVVGGLRDLLFAEQVRGNPGTWLVTLECGHKLATREQLAKYVCRECPSGPQGGGA